MQSLFFDDVNFTTTGRHFVGENVPSLCARLIASSATPNSGRSKSNAHIFCSDWAQDSDGELVIPWKIKLSLRDRSSNSSRRSRRETFSVTTFSRTSRVMCASNSNLKKKKSFSFYILKPVRNIGDLIFHLFLVYLYFICSSQQFWLTFLKKFAHVVKLLVSRVGTQIFLDIATWNQ